MEKHGCEYFPWRFNNKSRTIPCGKKLRIVALAPAVVHWSLDGWQTVTDTPTEDTGLFVHVADFPTEKLAPGRQIVFTFRWRQENRWEGTDYVVTVE